MSSYKPYKDKLYSKLYNHYKPIGITLDIEHIMLISYIVNTVKCRLHVSKTRPLTTFYDRSPFL